MTTTTAMKIIGFAHPLASHIGHVTSFHPSIVIACSTTNTAWPKWSNRT